MLDHPIIEKVRNFIEVGRKDPEAFSAEVAKQLAKDHYEAFIKHIFEEQFSRKFSLRMSNVGHPLCQLMMARDGKEPLPKEYDFTMKMMFGSSIEAQAIALMRLAGVNIEEVQTRVRLSFNIDGEVITIPGTLDLVIDGKVYDLKSASPTSFEKFKSYDTLKANDSFGYIEQIYGYAKARNVEPGGWIVIDKSTGRWCVLEVPEDYREEMVEALSTIRNNVVAIHKNEPFRRSFSDHAEVFKKKETGNRILKMPCSFCDYKYECWPSLQYHADVNSTAFKKPMKYYTELNTVPLDELPAPEPVAYESTVSES